MRIGINPAKEQIDLDHPYIHRILIPVYIPELSGYHEQSLEVLQLCMESLCKTIHSKTAITVINNACCKEVGDYLRSLKDAGKVNQLIENDRNIGKIDALFNVARGSYEPLITISDADVLFCNSWQEETERAFSEYASLGFVCPTPIPDNTFYFTSATFWNGLFKGTIMTETAKDSEGLRLFAESIGKEGEELEELTERNRQKISYYEKGKSKLILGGGHFVATIRRDALMHAPDSLSGKTILGNSEVRFIDEPVDRAGYMRCALSVSRAYHMGNVPEQWMRDKLAATTQESHEPKIPTVGNPIKLSYWWRRKIIHFMKRKFPSFR